MWLPPRSFTKHYFKKLKVLLSWAMITKQIFPISLNAHSPEACESDIDFEIYLFIFIWFGFKIGYLHSPESQSFQTFSVRNQTLRSRCLQMWLFLTLHCKSFSFRSSKLTERRCSCPTGALLRRASPDGLASAMAKSSSRRSTRNCPNWQPHAGKSRVSLVSLRQHGCFLLSRRAGGGRDGGRVRFRGRMGKYEVTQRSWALPSTQLLQDVMVTSVKINQKE